MRNALPDAAGLNPWLWLRMRLTMGVQASIYKMLVIAGGHVAATLYLVNVPLLGGPEFSGVIEREL